MASGELRICYQLHNLEVNFKDRRHQKTSVDLKSLSECLHTKKTDKFTLLGLTVDTHQTCESQSKMLNVNSQISRTIHYPS